MLRGDGVGIGVAAVAPGDPGWLPTQGSHRSGRAHWSASGSSEHGFTTRGNQGGYPLSLRGHGAKAQSPCHVSLQRLHAPASPSLPRVPVVRVPLVHRYYETLRLPTAPHAALRFLRLALPRFPCPASLPHGTRSMRAWGFG